MRLSAVPVPVANISVKEERDMLHIMQAYYGNVTPEQFTKDLREKDLVILLRKNGSIRGFSTQKLFDHDIEGRPVRVIFSGDTIIERNCWGSLALPVAWGRMMLSILSELPDRDLYWLLTCKGYKTYRFLPVFFREFYPSCTKETPPFEKALLRSLGRRKFGDRFNKDSWIIRAPEGGQRLRPGVAEIDEARCRDKHIAFFEKANPGHARGDELACIAPCHESNLKPFILRRLRP